MGTTLADYLIVGSGISGSFIALDLVRAGARVIVLEAGEDFSSDKYPTTELDANSRLYWSGGIEFNRGTTLGFLRPKVVGGGSVVNQALVDRFDTLAFDSWRNKTGISYLNRNEMDPFYDAASSEIITEKIPTQAMNGNAEIFAEGFRKRGFAYTELTRAQAGCRYSEGNDCIACLAGCRIESKQSMPVTTLRKARAGGLQLEDRFEAKIVREESDFVSVEGVDRYGRKAEFRAKNLVLAAGAIGNSLLLLRSGFASKFPALGADFFCHPQFMVLGLYQKKIRSHRGPLQTFKSDDPSFRNAGFKLENVFAPPIAISMLVPGMGREHRDVMRRYDEMACIEVAVRDTSPGQIRISSGGSPRVTKTLNAEDLRRRQAGLTAVREIFESTGVERIIEGILPIGLHLMGGLGLGSDASHSVVAPDFSLHGTKRMYCADSSVFPDAPGINPSFTIMALAKRAVQSIMKLGGAR